MNETMSKPTTGKQCPALFDKWLINQTSWLGLMDVFIFSPNASDTVYTASLDVFPLT